MKTQLFFLALLGLSLVAVHAEDEESTTEEPEPTPAPTTTTTANPGQSYGALCNGLLLRCNRYSETVACVQRRPDPTTVAPPETDPPTTDDPIISMFQRRNNPAPQDICETGLGVDLGRCQCQRNCKSGVYVDDGMFDEERQICVGLVGSQCSLLVPNCVPNGRCNLLTSKCICNNGFVEDENRRCVPSRK